IKNPIDETYGAYGTRPNIPAAIFTIPVIENAPRYWLFDVSSSYNTSDPFNAPNVFAIFSIPAKTAVKIMPILNAGFPNGNNSNLNEVIDSFALGLKIKTNNIQPTIIPIKRPYLRT